ncbi:AAA family ATPase [Streptomyces sp. F63]|uniref:AAA family ATPase n=1 Tax=Streptomyces sp. F63 TaxID=2824887 RepID=UPI001FFC37AB|nr:AAA family ATPase [Streptomyces sp. F63]
MTVTEQPEQNEHHPADPAPPTPAGQSLPVAELVQARLAEARLTEPVKVLLKEALGDGETGRTAPMGRTYLESVAVTRFRGIGAPARLKLSPRPGVNLVVGRNGSGKSSIAEGIETAFTGTNARWHGQHPTRSANWRNLHYTDGRPEIEVKLAIEGDTGRSTLVRTWDGDDFDDSRGEFRRPGHGRVPLDRVDWKQALTDFRPFLSYVDLDRMISGKPSQMYDAIATILGLGGLSAAESRIREEIKGLDAAAKAVKEELPGLKDALYELEDDDRAVQALVAVDTAGTPDFAVLDALVAGLPTDTDTTARSPSCAPRLPWKGPTPAGSARPWTGCARPSPASRTCAGPAARTPSSARTCWSGRWPTTTVTPTRQPARCAERAGCWTRPGRTTPPPRSPRCGRKRRRPRPHAANSGRPRTPYGISCTRRRGSPSP